MGQSCVAPAGDQKSSTLGNSEGQDMYVVDDSDNAVHKDVTPLFRVRRTMGRSSSLRFMPGNEELVVRPPTDKTTEERELIRGSLRSNPNLPRLCVLSEDQIEKLIDVAWKDEAETGDMVMREGDLDSATFFIVASGSCEVEAREPFEVASKGEFSYLSRPQLRTSVQWDPSSNSDDKTKSTSKVVKRIGKGSSFGDSSMLYGAPRWCTVTALEPCVIWNINQSNFKIIQQWNNDELQRNLRKSTEDETMIAKVLHTNENLQRLTPLHDEHIKPLVKLAWEQKVEGGLMLMKEGDLNADAFYIVASGNFEFSGTEPFQVVETGDVSHFSRAAHTGDALSPDAKSFFTKTTRGRGHCFGEISMLYCAPRFSDVRALEDSTLWAIDRSSFQFVQMKAAEDELKDRCKYLDELDINILRTFSADDKEKFAGIMEKLRLTQNEELLSQGSTPANLFILIEGTVETSDGANTYTANPEQKLVHYFGQESLTNQKAKSKETVRVKTPTATCLILGSDDFMKICDAVLDSVPPPSFERYTTSVSKAKTQPSNEQDISDLTVVGVLGYSICGTISLVQKNSTGEFFAKKDLAKGLVVQQGLRKSVVREKMLWSEVTTPFIVRLHATYNEPQQVSFLLEAALGGELAACYASNNFYGSEKHAQYYVAGVVQAFEHLHKRGIIYRNLKPQNILLSSTGTPKLTDMCLAKRVVGYTYTTCGTPTYMAPEIIRGSGHTRAVDWWTLGVMTFELLSTDRKGPFDSEHSMEIYSNVMRGINRVEFPKSFGGHAADLITSLLHPVAIDRLPMRQGGIRNIIGHGWFEGFDWEKMSSGQLDPPYRPSQSWQSNFTPRQGKMKKPIEYSPIAAIDDSEFDTPWDAAFAMLEEP